MLLKVQQCSSACALSRSVSRHAAIDGNLRPGDVARSIRREKADRFGNFLSGTGNADRDHRFRNLVRIENMRAGRSVPGTADFLRTMLAPGRSEEHTSELQSLMRHPSAVFCLKKQNTYTT